MRIHGRLEAKEGLGGREGRGEVDLLRSQGGAGFREAAELVGTRIQVV